MEEKTRLNFVNEIYTPISLIELELSRRRKDKELVKKVEDFLGDYILPELKSEPKAVLSRALITPNQEFKYFMDIVKEINLEPLGLEYHDKLVAKNSEKYHL